MITRRRVTGAAVGFTAAVVLTAPLTRRTAAREVSTLQLKDVDRLRVAGPLRAGTGLLPGHLSVQPVPDACTPGEDAIPAEELDAVVGRRLTVSLPDGALLRYSHFVPDPPAGR